MLNPDSVGIAFSQGFATSAGLIIAIGAQNSYVLTQGIKRRYHWQIAALCSLIDAALIVAGVLGLGVLVQQLPLLLPVVTWGGILFLFLYGARALRAALRPGALGSSARGSATLAAALTTTLALSLLNPHVYLDTLILLGSIGSQHPPATQPWFAGGAVLASLCWFFTLALGAQKLAPWFQQPRAWQALDLLVWLMMWAVATGLLLRTLG